MDYFSQDIRASKYRLSPGIMPCDVSGDVTPELPLGFSPAGTDMPRGVEAGMGYSTAHPDTPSHHHQADSYSIQ